MPEEKIWKKCKICGLEFFGYSRKQYCSKECSNKARSATIKALNDVKRAEREKEQQRRAKLGVNPIRAISWAARQRGMTYGTFVATLKDGDEERICREYLEYFKKKKEEKSNDAE